MDVGSFPPAGVTYLNLGHCLLPDHPAALDFPGVDVDVTVRRPSTTAPPSRRRTGP
ncbi:hypothetical protein GCM10010103_62910 [Streptomyces paradoxus]|uniref:Uncharacterized protein n=1 Tax=Streptomyces paradoxus TaxID=66375 RepID=A0A7W9TI14_9ACTN|nr:hypothetical protein [Streptomyces paradoxus]